MITAVLDEIGGNTNSDDFSEAAQNCVAKTVHLVWSMVHFPPGNIAVRKSMDAWKSAVQDVLRIQNSFVLTVLNGRLYFEDTLHAKVDDTANNFIQAMSHRRIRKVIFWRGCDEPDLEGYAKVMKTSPDDLLEAGGVLRFCRDMKMKDIKLIEARYLPGEEHRGGREYWERKLDESGLDSGEVVALCSGRARQPRIITAELMLLVEAMKDPRFLSQLLWRVALGESGQGSPDPQELLRIFKRAQYLLVVNAGFDAEQIPQILSRAMQSYEPSFRLALLRTQLALQTAGIEMFDERIMAFQPQEYAEYIVRGREREGDWRKYVDPIRLTPGEAMNVCRAVETRLWTSAKLKVDTMQATSEIESLEQNLTRALECPHIAATDPSLSSPGSQDQAIESLKGRAAAFGPDLTEAYTYVLLHLYFSALDGQWARNLLDRLVIIIEARLEARRYPEVISLLRAICSDRFTPERLAASKNRLREAFKNIPKAPLIKFLTDQITAGDQQLIDLVPEIVDLFGEDVFEKMIEGLLSKETDQPSPVAVGLLARHQRLMVSILTRLADDGNPWVRVRCYELLCTVPDSHAQDVALKGTADRNANARFLAYLAMGKGASDRGIAQLMDTARAEHKTGKIFVHKDSCAAIHSLGALKCAAAVPVLEHILKRKHWKRMPWYELKACAAQALRLIATEKAAQILQREMPDVDATIITVVIRRAKRAIQKVMHFLLAPFRWALGLVFRRGSRKIAAGAPVPVPVAAAQPPGGESR